MTVSKQDMKLRPRIMRVEDDNDREERWKELPDVKDGKRENWMTDRAKNALGTAKLASVFLEEEQGRICRLRNIKSALVSGKFMGSGTSSTSGTFGTNRRRRRPFPDTSYNVGRHAGSQHQAGMMPPSAYGQLLAEGKLPLLIPNYPAAPFRDKGKDTLLPGSHATREPPLEHSITKGRRKAGRSGLHHDAKSDSSAAAGRTHVYGGARRSKSSVPEINGGLSPSGAARRGGEVIPNVGGALLNHHGRSGFKDEQSQPGLACRTGEGGGQVISSGPSAIDLFDQCGFVVPDAVIKVEGLVGTSRPCQSWKSPSDDHDMVDIMVTTPPAPGQGIARVSPVAIPPVVPGGEWVDSIGSRVHQRNSGRQEKRVPKATRRSHVAPGHRRPPVSGDSPPSPPRGSRSKAAPGRGAGPTKNNRRMRRGVGDTAEKRNSRIGYSNGPSPTEAKAPVKADRVRRRWNINEPSATIPAPSLPTAGQDETVTSSEQRLVSAQARLHKSKNLDALKSEHVEALSILQDISCPSAVEARGATSDGDEKREYIDVQPASSVPQERSTSKTTRSPTYLAHYAVGLAGARTRGVFGPGDADYEALSADLPRPDSREQAALRLLYRKWWTEVTNDGGTSNVPDPLEVSEPPRDTAFEEWRRKFVDGGGGGSSGGATLVAQWSVYEGAARKYIEGLVEAAVEKAAGVSNGQASGTAGADDTADISILARLQGVQETAAALDRCNSRCMAEAENDRDAVRTNESPQPVGGGSAVAPHQPLASPPTPSPVPTNKINPPRVAARHMPSPARRTGNGKPLQGRRHHARPKRQGAVEESTPGVTTNNTKQYGDSRAVARATPSPARRAGKGRPLQERRPRARQKRDGARGLVSVEDPTPRVSAHNTNYYRATPRATPPLAGPEGNGKSPPDGRRDVHPKHDEARGVVAVEEPFSPVTANHATLPAAAASATTPASAGRAENGNLRQVTRDLARLENGAREDKERGVGAIEDEGVDSVLDEDDLEAEEEQGHDGRIYLPDGRFVSTLRISSDDKGDAAEAVHGDENVDVGDGGTSVFEAMRDEGVARASESNDDGEYGDDDFEH